MRRLVAPLAAFFLSGLLQGCRDVVYETDTKSAEIVAGACEIPLPEAVSLVMVYDYNRSRDGYGCDIGQKPAIIVPQAGGCGDPLLSPFSGGRPLSGASASEKLMTCNPAFAPQSRAGVYSTVIQLDEPNIPQRQISEFDRLINDIALRVPMGVQYVIGGGGFYCFQYSDVSRFRESFEQIRTLLPNGASTEHLDGGVCDSKMIEHGRRPK